MRTNKSTRQGFEESADRSNRESAKAPMREVVAPALNSSASVQASCPVCGAGPPVGTPHYSFCKQSAQDSKKLVVETEWSTAQVYIVNGVRFDQEKFFQAKKQASSGRASLSELIQPDELGYLDLLPFLGKRTRITIEVL